MHNEKLNINAYLDTYRSQQAKRARYYRDLEFAASDA